MVAWHEVPGKAIPMNPSRRVRSEQAPVVDFGRAAFLLHTIFRGATNHTVPSGTTQVLLSKRSSCSRLAKIRQHFGQMQSFHF